MIRYLKSVLLEFWTGQPSVDDEERRNTNQEQESRSGKVETPEKRAQWRGGKSPRNRVGATKLADPCSTIRPRCGLQCRPQKRWPLQLHTTDSPRHLLPLDPQDRGGITRVSGPSTLSVLSKPPIGGIVCVWERESWELKPSVRATPGASIPPWVVEANPPPPMVTPPPPPDGQPPMVHPHGHPRWFTEGIMAWSMPRTYHSHVGVSEHEEMIKAPIIFEGIMPPRKEARWEVEQLEIYHYSPWTQTMQWLKWFINTGETFATPRPCSTLPIFFLPLYRLSYNS